MKDAKGPLLLRHEQLIRIYRVIMIYLVTRWKSLGNT